MTPLEPDPSISPRIQFGTELRKFRLSAGFTQRQLCEAVHLSISQLSMIENGHRAPTMDLAQRADKILGLNGALASFLDRLNRAAAQLPRWFRPWLDYEREAEALHIWELAMVPGLLQVEGYARALIANEPGATSDQIDERVCARLNRQKILQRPSPPMLWVVLDESVLHRMVGDPTVMSDQLNHLLEWSRSRSGSLQILPHTAYSTVGLLGSFTVADMPGRPASVAYIDSQSMEDRVSDSTAEARGLAFRHGVIRADALPRRESLHMIKEALRRWSM
ncbi:transcriptional regulator [Sphaerisporangium melleum]|uniref:Transcriptional regulator n=1 Tax=Sphaerisporangium melleum TaxID=321316 RepID=A0A917VH20_9ACTN|nr:helix-turn-helix transcriptional regulator [Sphaerisporangium melleum]GGK75387.1 transcriptional regulator [Sphaerisporangium melleum]GII72624.1 transcriptional regulator [Sphaerisporangium melleum]